MARAVGSRPRCSPSVSSGPGCSPSRRSPARPPTPSPRRCVGRRGSDASCPTLARSTA
jgi:hypothetical protein